MVQSLLRCNQGIENRLKRMQEQQRWRSSIETSSYQQGDKEKMLLHLYKLYNSVNIVELRPTIFAKLKPLKTETSDCIRERNVPRKDRLMSSRSADYPLR